MPTPGAIAAFEQLHAPCSPRLRRGVALRRTTPTGMATDPPAEPGAANARGMTLVEILVVLALLVVIGGLVVPVFEGSIASVRLRRAGDQVVTGWSRARAEAIESGQPYQFRFTPDTGTFVIEPWTGLLGSEGSSAARTTTDGATSTSTATSTTSSSTSSTATSAETSSSVTNTALPDEIVFQSGELAVEDFQSGERSVASLQDAGESLSTPILFFPDGTASEASILLTNGKQQFVRVTLRGLTGVGRASEVLTQEELQRADRRK
jgi:prepilin-type N-terminal cleavage/methylation domain-containing protein